MSTELPTEPIGPEEHYLAKIAGEDVPLPEKPVGRKEHYLAYIAENGGGGGGGGGTTNYNNLSNKPKINNVELKGSKSLSDLGIQPAGNYLTSETDPVFSASASAGIENSDITNWNNKQAALVSGTNIKTINNQSLLGSGNITIEGGSGGGGISGVAKTLLISILKKCYTSQNTSAEIDSLETELSRTTELTSISVSYTGGDIEVGTLTDTLPIIVTASYSDGSTGRINSGYTLSPTTISEGSNTITVTYSGKTATFTVTGVEITGELTSISAVCNDQTAVIGTSASELDITVTGHYSDSTTALLNGWTISGTVAEGTNTFTVTYQSFTTTVTVTGVAGQKTLSSIAVTSEANSAEIGATTAEIPGIIVTATYSDNTTETLSPSDYTVTPATIVSGTNVLIYSYENKTTTFNIEGVDLTGLTVSSVTPTLTKTTYPVGAYLQFVVEGYYIANYPNNVKVAKNIIDNLQGIAPSLVTAGTSNYSFGLEGKYPTVSVTGETTSATWLENVVERDIHQYSYATKVAYMTITDHNTVEIDSNGCDTMWINISEPNVYNKVGLNGTMPTRYTIPAGATIETSVKWNKVFNAFPKVRFALNPTGNTAEDSKILLMEAYSTGLVGTTSTNTITVENATDISGIYVLGRGSFNAGKELDFEISIKVNGTEILGGTYNG